MAELRGRTRQFRTALALPLHQESQIAPVMPGIEYIRADLEIYERWVRIGRASVHAISED